MALRRGLDNLYIVKNGASEDNAVLNDKLGNVTMNFNKLFLLFIYILCTAVLPSLDAQDLFINAPTQQPPAQDSVQEPAETAPEPKKAVDPTGSTDAEQLQEVIKSQLAAIRSFDISRAYYAYTTKEFQKTVPLDVFKQFIKKYSVLFRNKHSTMEDVTFKNNVADYTGTLVSVDGDAYKVNIILVNVEGEWKIHSLGMDAQSSSRRQPLR